MNNPTHPSKHPENAASKIPEPAKAMSGWDLITKGSKVLAQVDKAEGFFPAIVEKVSDNGQTLTLRWVGFEKLPSFTMRKLACGLLFKAK